MKRKEKETRRKGDAETKYRVAQCYGSNWWQVKEGPFWKVVFKSTDLREISRFIRGLGVPLSRVQVSSESGWPTLEEMLARIPLRKEAA